MTDDRRPTPILFVDADSTIRHGYDELGRFVNGPDDVVLFPEVPATLAKWKQATQGRIVVVSNQGGIGLGYCDPDQVRAAFSRTGELLDSAVLGLTLDMRTPISIPLIDQFMWCPHAPTYECWCRKPGPGMAIRALKILEDRYPMERYPTGTAHLIGDRPEDRQMAATLAIPFTEAAEWRDPRLMLAVARGAHWLGNAETIMLGGKRAECGGCLATFDRPDPPVHTTRWATDAIEAHIWDEARDLGERRARDAQIADERNDSARDHADAALADGGPTDREEP